MRVVLVLLIAACSHATETPNPARYDVHVDRRVELLSIIEWLAGAPEYQSAPATTYVGEVRAHFGPFASHPVVLAARQLREQHGISYDAPMTLAICLDPNMHVHAQPDDARFTGVDLATFVDQVGDFATQSKFDAFVAAHHAYYTRVEDRLRTAIAKEDPARWFDAFFGQRASAHFTVVPGMLTGNWNYGPHSADDLYQIIGVARPDFDELPAVDDATIELLVHEMAHSYVNPVLAAHHAELEPGASHAFVQVGDAMKKQAYTTWEIFLNESVVRAVVVLYTRERRGAAAADAAIAREEARSFVWTRQLADLLATKRGDFAAAVPQIAPLLAAAN
ncbi:MAG TPA: DUF4932 domain-containing protein [Kofleriaceae bacterium]|nr:DUF4932 domain-containing protein [Kofleriaceae bacterium]